MVFNDNGEYYPLFRANSQVSEAKPGLAFPIEPKTLVAEFLEKCAKDAASGCWVWKGKVSHKRSPIFCFHGRNTSALKTAWELFVGAPPSNGQFRRTCGNALCVNPRHLRHAHLEMAKRKDRASPFRKLSAEAVMQIRSSTKSKSALAREFGVTEWTIWAVRSGRRGKIVPIEPAVDFRTVRDLERKAFVEKTVELLKDLNNAGSLD